jgi:hypothetical protein
VRQSDAVLLHPKARAVLEVGGEREVSMFATDPDTGVRLRGRADLVPPIVDVKTTTDLRLHKLSAVVDGFGYDLQAEMYRFLYELITGEVAEPVTLIFTEKDPPYDVRVVTLGDDWIEGGWRKVREGIELFDRCSVSRLWPGVDEDGPVEELPAPSWYSARVARIEREEGML